MDWYNRLIRPLLFRLPAETAHDLIHRGLRSPLPARWVGRDSRFEDHRLNTDIAGIPLANPLGLAPGLDKNGESIEGFDQLGFGYLVVGSVTAEPRPGNPKPRMVRYPERLSIGNSLGLPSLGLAAVAEILGNIPATRAKLIVSVAGFSSEELVRGAERLAPLVDAVEIGLICPNTTESERMEEIAIFTDLARGLKREVAKPVFIKLPPHHDEAQREQVMKMLDVCMEHDIDGVSVSGGRTVPEGRLAAGSGSLNGKATYGDALRITGDVARHTGRGLDIKASGGVFNGQDAVAMLRAGATTVEIYTSLVYRGWRAVGSIKCGILDEIEARGLSDLRSLRGEAMQARDQGTVTD
jgi:dihydroorotate dehydrogenase